MSIRIGIAGWALRKDSHDSLLGEGTHLERYARVFNCVEINSSFYRPHRKSTYERWAQCTPGNFQFTVKVPRTITHKKRLLDCEADLDRFLDEVAGLGEKLGPLLVQLPPSLSWAKDAAGSFFEALRERHRGPVVIEPRHPSWFEAGPTRQLQAFAICRVTADPSVVSASDGCSVPTLDYFRLHGSPRTYYSSYSEETLLRLAETLSKSDRQSKVAWCIFDNTAANAALGNALTLKHILKS